ncbi:MAG: conjugative transposon protein TraN [Muribaculaceae bacterium]|nr:conjugative transposon protein TraN [Muribaculaceae bacterium]
MKKISLFLTLTLTILSISPTFADNSGRNIIQVNRQVTTHIVMPENLKMVDISTDEIVGNQCADNMVRLKPVVTDSIFGGRTFNHGDFLGTITMVGERHVAQYDIIYEEDPSKAVSMYTVDYEESMAYNNPDISMPESEMARLAWAAYGSRRKFHNIRNSQYGMLAEVYNIYSVGNYFFIDFCLKNQTKVPYDISEMRLTLSDKKETKSTNFQTIELTPSFVLNKAKSFKKGFRQVIVLEKLTFPNDKILNIEIAENQISGRVISLSIRYEDILNADCFDMEKVEDVKDMNTTPSFDPVLSRNYDTLAKENSDLKDELTKTKAELKAIRSKLETFTQSVKDALK